MQNTLTKQVLAEFIGTFALVFFGCAAVASGQGVAVAALAHGLTVLGMAYAYGHISSTVINPAVTLGLMLTGKMDMVRGAAYMVAQFAGGIAAAVALSQILNTTNIGPTVGSMTSDSIKSAAAFEFLMTFIFVTVIFQTAVYGKGGTMAGVAIGFTLVAAIVAGGTYTGASLNPARTLGPALITGELSYVLPYFIGIFGGGAAAALVQRYLLGPVD